MKITDQNFEQSGFTHKRIMLCLFWLRSRRYTPDFLRASMKDMLFVGLEHYFSEKMATIKSYYVRLREKIRPSEPTE